MARDYWGFGFDQNAGTVSFGPYVIHIDAAERAAKELCHAIYMAAREVDKKNVAELRTKTIDTLMVADIACDSPDVVLKVSPGVDLKNWLSRCHTERAACPRIHFCSRVPVGIISRVRRVLIGGERTTNLLR